MGVLRRATGWWEKHGMPRAVDVVLNDRFIGPWRDRTAGAATGTVLEIGFGSGLNLPHYPDTVDTVLAVDPSDGGWRAARTRIAEFGRPVERLGRDAATIPLADHSVDTVVSTWSLCTIPDVTSALAEARRVLRPGGTFVLVEHSLAPSPRVRRFQRRIQPAWGFVAGGCHVDRDIARLVADAGFDTSDLTARDAFGRLPFRPWSWFVSGAAQ